MCAAHDGPDCLDSNPELVTFWSGAYTTGVSAGTWYVGGPQTFTAQTALKFVTNVTPSPNAKTTTIVHVYDASGELSP